MSQAENTKKKVSIRSLESGGFAVFVDEKRQPGNFPTRDKAAQRKKILDRNLNGVKAKPYTAREKQLADKVNQLEKELGKSEVTDTPETTAKLADLETRLGAAQDRIGELENEITDKTARIAELEAAQPGSDEE